VKDCFYDDPHYNYQQYWRRRRYEHHAEKIALKKLLNLVFNKRVLVDVGGGFGRLIPTYISLCQKCFLIDPSKKMLQQAEKLKKKYPHLYSHLKLREGIAENLPLKDKSVDVILFIRTLHHLKKPQPALKEFSRVLKPQGYLIIEFANKVHFKSIIRSLFRLDFQYPFNLQPVTIGKKKQPIPFLNYHPKQIRNLLDQSGFKIIKTLSVSNFRNSPFKKILPLKILLFLEGLIQEISLPFYYGPSIFLLVQKKTWEK